MSQMTLESGERLPARQQQQVGVRQQEQDNLACPRCDSTNTKFCYYNNYNLSQPRHFCKSCRRYWTRGGALRNVPVGGGTRKSSSSSSSKRARSIPPSNASSCSSSSSTSVTYQVVPGSSVSYINGIKPEMVFRAPVCGGVNLNEAVQVPGTGTFTSLLNTQPGCGFVAVDGFGAGLGSGFHGMGFGLSIWDWPTVQVGEPNSGGGGSEMGGVDGDCFGWPELAISTPGNGLK